MKSFFPAIMTNNDNGSLTDQTSGFLQVKEHKLSNGLVVWLNEDHSQPKVFGAVVVKAGAKDTPNTGIAHYFEHMMFKGTDKIGTLDYSAEKALLDLIAEKYDALAETKDPKMRAHLQQIINDLSVRAAEYVIPNEFDRLISRFGGTKLNAGTSYDYTIYFNTFSPQYIAQWAEINSERLVNPVFRLFQNELETVYEEKNMRGDTVASQALEKLTERYFYPHPYAYPIIGSAENLKNPRLSEMRKFFETYYVASNMGLILSGDFDEKIVLPILESTFSRVRKGVAPKKVTVELPPFKGREKVAIRLPMHFVRIMGMGFRGVPANHKDQVALNVAVSLLNNSNGTGFLDKLTVDHKVVGAVAINDSMNEAGILGLLVFPKFFFQTYASVEKLVWKQINRIKEGDFSEETFQSLKLEQKREYSSNLENISSRADIMMRIFSQGKSWNEYLEEVSRIDALTKEDVMEAARNYFTENYLYITKKNGRYPNTSLPKPNYAPIVPKNSDASSEYVKCLEKIPAQALNPHFLNFEKDAQTVSLRPLVTFYSTRNNVNDIFTLTLSYEVGKLEWRELEKLALYLPYVVPNSFSFESFRGKLQELGSTLTFDVNDSVFLVMVNGFDQNFTETMALVGDFMRHAKPDNKKIRQLVNEAKVAERTLFNSSEGMARVLLEMVKFGKQSRFLTKLSIADTKKLNGEKLLDTFKKVIQVECDVHYCGTLPTKFVTGEIGRHLPLGEVVNASNSPFIRDIVKYDKPTVFFMDMKDVVQSIIYGYMPMDPLKSVEDYHLSRLFNGYFGGDMSSLMFQEIREFRSLAYEVSAHVKYPPLRRSEKSARFITKLSTQADKTIDAMEVLASLINNMPERPERIEAVKQTIRNQANNEYPSSRSISLKIAAFRRDGYDSDPNKEFLEAIEGMTMQEVMRYYQDNIQGRPMVYAVIGNAAAIDMKRLANFGTIVKVTKKDIYK